MSFALEYHLGYDDGRAVPIASLGRWLHGQWALLFSHPDDFASYGFEADRWLVHVRESFAATGVRPLALAATATSLAADWIIDAGGCVTGPIDEIQRYPVARDPHAGLRAALDDSRRFVITLDDSLRPRRTFFYTRQDRLPSPMDLAAAAERLRRQCVQHTKQSGRSATTIAPPCLLSTSSRS
jgi:hypothetical protein